MNPKEKLNSIQTRIKGIANQFQIQEKKEEKRCKKRKNVEKRCKK